MPAKACLCSGYVLRVEVLPEQDERPALANRGTDRRRGRRLGATGGMGVPRCRAQLGDGHAELHQRARRFHAALQAQRGQQVRRRCLIAAGGACFLGRDTEDGKGARMPGEWRGIGERLPHLQRYLPACIS